MSDYFNYRNNQFCAEQVSLADIAQRFGTPCADILCLNVESESELTRLNEVAGQMDKVAPVSLRVNPASASLLNSLSVLIYLLRLAVVRWLAISNSSSELMLANAAASSNTTSLTRNVLSQSPTLRLPEPR